MSIHNKIIVRLWYKKYRHYHKHQMRISIKNLLCAPKNREYTVSVEGRDHTQWVTNLSNKYNIAQVTSARQKRSRCDMCGGCLLSLGAGGGALLRPGRGRYMSGVLDPGTDTWVEKVEARVAQVQRPRRGYTRQSWRRRGTGAIIHALIHPLIH